MDMIETVTEEQKKFAIDAIVTLTVDEISLETGEDAMAILPKFIESKTAETLYDESSKLWWNGPAYIAEMYLAETVKESLSRSEQQIKDGKVNDARDSLNAVREKHLK